MLPIKIESFEGPLDLLLKLIEQEQLDITEVSLARVTGQYLELLKELAAERQSDELADFLVIASKLVLIKSRQLLPVITAEDEEEIEDLTRQLKLYQEFVRGAKMLEKLYLARRVLFGRPAVVPEQEKTFSPPPGIDGIVLQKNFQKTISAIQLPIRAPKRIMFETRMTLSERIRSLHAHVAAVAGLSFHHAFGRDANRADIVITFLALLELIKQQHVHASQEEPFSEISIHALTTTIAVPT